MDSSPNDDYSLDLNVTPTSFIVDGNSESEVSIKRNPKRKRKNPNLSRYVTPASFIAYGNSESEEEADDFSLDPSWNVTPTSFIASGNSNPEDDFSLLNNKPKRDSKRQRKNSTSPSHNATPTSFNASKPKGKKITTKRCENLACKAILRREDIFCERCSCFICYKYDGYKKDTSMWLTCKSDPPFEGKSCGFSCHLNCLKEGDINADGCFSCVSCGKRNDLFECLKKTLMIAKETRTVKVLCSCLVLAKKLLKGVDKYREVSETVEKAVESLEAEFNGCPLSGLPSLMIRGIVDKLRSNSQVKNLCCSALTLLEMQGLTKELKEDEVKVISTKMSQEENEQTLLANTNKDLSAIEGKKLKNIKTCGPKKPEKGGSKLTKCIKIIRQLEHLGHMKKDSREKFFTWYSLTATAEEKHVVETIIDNFKDDLKALADQLLHTFSDCISRKRSATDSVDGGFVVGV